MRIEQGRALDAHWCPSPNYNKRPDSESGLISLLVIHNISLPPGEYGRGYVHQFFQNELNPLDHPYFETIADLQVSSHFLIERSGQLTQFVNTQDRAWHAGASCYQGRENCNDFSIGVELEGTDNEPYTDLQYQTLIELTKALMVTYPAITAGRITGHQFIAPRRKTDPGFAFEWQRLFQGIRR